MREQGLQIESAISVSIARQPIFDENNHLWGYALFCVGTSQATPSGFPEEENVAWSVEPAANMCLQRTLERGKTVIVAFDEKSILEKAPYALPPVLTAIQVSESASVQPEVLELLNQMKSDGYLIAIDGFSGKTDLSPFYALADLIQIGVENKGTDELAAAFMKARPYRALLLASHIRDRMQFKFCRELGFSLFHGSFFKSPSKMEVRKFPAGAPLKFSILELTENEEPDFAKLSARIQSDVTVSFRLLTYLNSAAFAFRQNIKSIQQAITLVGWRQLRTWLRVVLLADIGQTKEAHELVLLSAQRGVFLEQIAKEHAACGLNPDSMHLLGLLSLLDSLLGLPMSEIVGHLPIDSSLKAALCRDPSSEYIPLLHLTQYLEEAMWADAARLMKQLNLDNEKVKTALRTAINWTNTLDSAHFDKSA
jgi:EAL and modified HD-GYP domain-containing signal transduction protein